MNLADVILVLTINLGIALVFQLLLKRTMEGFGSRIFFSSIFSLFFFWLLTRSH